MHPGDMDTGPPVNPARLTQPRVGWSRPPAGLVGAEKTSRGGACSAHMIEQLATELMIRQLFIPIRLCDLNAPPCEGPQPRGSTG